VQWLVLLSLFSFLSATPHKLSAYPDLSNNLTKTLEFLQFIAQNKDAFSTRELPRLGAPWTCAATGRSNPRPDNVRQLLPGDVDLICALGDSIVAAFGALSKTIFDVFKEWRGYSFAAGGETNVENFISVPNILKAYYPGVKGFSTGTGNQDSAFAHLNVAVSGARSRDMSAQVPKLIAKINQQYNMQNDWKLLNFFVGGNDLCDYCRDNKTNSPANYKSNIEKALDEIQANIPKAFVNLIAPPDITLLGQVSSGLCSILHGFECSCANDVASHNIYPDYIRALFDIEATAKYHTRNFHVTVQPFLVETKLPQKNGKPDIDYFAPDCFHFSGLAHQAASVALWNNMMQAAGKKQLDWTPGEHLICAKVDQYLQ